MLREVDRTTSYTGIGYLGEEISDFADDHSLTSSSSLTPAYSSRAVIRSPRPSSNIYLDSYPAELLNEFKLETTGSELPDLFVLSILFGFQRVAVTDYRITYITNKLPFKKHITVSSSEPLFFATPAEQLRVITGLEVELLANIFEVSRTTYHKWINGSLPNSKHREHLLEVLSNVEKAAQRYASQSATANWLLTPTSATGKKPIEYLAMRQYSIFRGLLLRVRTGQEQVRPLTPSNRIYRELSDEEMKDAIERLRPRARVEEDDKEE